MANLELPYLAPNRLQTTIPNKMHIAGAPNPAGDILEPTTPEPGTCILKPHKMHKPLPLMTAETLARFLNDVGANPACCKCTHRRSVARRKFMFTSNRTKCIKAVLFQTPSIPHSALPKHKAAGRSNQTFCISRIALHFFCRVVCFLHSKAARQTDDAGIHHAKPNKLHGVRSRREPRCHSQRENAAWCQE